MVCSCCEMCIFQTNDLVAFTTSFILFYFFCGISLLDLSSCLRGESLSYCTFRLQYYHDSNKKMAFL